MRDRGDAVDEARRRRACAACRARGRQREPAHHRAEREPAGDPDREPDRHLERELAHDDPEASRPHASRARSSRSSARSRPGRSRPTRRAGSSRCGRRSRGRRAPRTSPPGRSARPRRRAGRRRSSEARAPSARRARSRPRSRTCRGARATTIGTRGGAEAAPADREAAVEEDHDQRDRGDPLDGLASRRSSDGKTSDAKAAGDEERCGRRGSRRARSASCVRSAHESAPATIRIAVPKVVTSCIAADANPPGRKPPRVLREFLTFLSCTAYFGRRYSSMPMRRIAPHPARRACSLAAARGARRRHGERRAARSSSPTRTRRRSSCREAA